MGANIKTDFQEMGWGHGLDWSGCAFGGDRAKWERSTHCIDQKMPSKFLSVNLQGKFRITFEWLSQEEWDKQGV